MSLASSVIRAAGLAGAVGLLALTACGPEEGQARADAPRGGARAGAVVPDTSGGVIRLPPAAFPELPDAVVRALEERHCTIPQSFASDAPHNVVRGRLADPGQTDWAALCSRDDSSRVVVVWGGPARCPEPLPATPDRVWLQGLTEGPELSYSRMLAVLTPEEAAEAAAVGHDLLDDRFLEKASTTRACEGGRWRVVGGAD